MKNFNYMGEAVKEKLVAIGLIPWPFVLAENIITLIIASKVSLHLPMTEVPFTFQSLFIAFIGMVYGTRTGLLGVGTYLFLGFIGLPVFSGSTAGVAPFLGPTGGFLVCFLPAVALAGGFAKLGWHRSFRKSVLAFFASQSFILVGGLFWLQIAGNPSQSIITTFLTLMPGLVLKTIIGALLIKLFWHWLTQVYAHEKSA